MLACASALFGISLGHSASYILTIYWKTLAVALLLIVSLRNMSDVRHMVWATAVGGVLLSFTAVFIDHISKTQGNAVYDANDIGAIVVMTLPLVILAVQMAKGIRRLAWLGGLGLIAVTIVISGSRGAFVGLLAVGLALLLFLPGVSMVKRLVYLGAITHGAGAVRPRGLLGFDEEHHRNPTPTTTGTLARADVRSPSAEWSTCSSIRSSVLGSTTSRCRRGCTPTTPRKPWRAATV